jgi:hypothetical protein
MIPVNVHIHPNYFHLQAVSTISTYAVELWISTNETKTLLGRDVRAEGRLSR